MKRIKVLLFLATIFVTTTSFDLNEDFREKYKEAIDLFEANASEILNQCSLTEKYQICSALVFPEFIRYSELKDFFETEALKSGYVMVGTELVDFSIGYCQMKPSFVEKIEAYIRNSNSLQKDFKDVILYKDTLLKGIRRERIERLEKAAWQFRYLSCFYEIMQELTSDFKWNSIEDKLRYYSTAYNYNFLASTEDILHMYSKKYFPYGPEYTGNQYRYSDIAIQFYKSYFTN